MNVVEAAVSLSNVYFYYDGQCALDNINLTIKQGDFLAILGPNGGGKTTLLKIMLGLLTPQQGQVALFGVAPHNAIAKVGYVPQQSSVNRDFPITTLYTVLMGLPTRSGVLRYSQEEKQQAIEALARVGVAHLANKALQQLSGGERQRVLIARALVSHPELLIFDEPTSNIDPYGKSCFFELLASLVGTITLVMVSHDLSIIAANITSIACVNRLLMYTPHPSLTKEMLPFIYGMHDHECPASNYLNELTQLLNKDSLNA